VADQDKFGAVPLLLGGWDFLPLNLVLLEIWNVADNDPRERPAKVHSFMHDEAQDSSS